MKTTKRAIDIVFGTVTLLALLPLMVLIALAVRLEDGKAPLYYQRRYGQDGKTFWLLKFRTMRTVAPDENRQIEDLKSDGRTTKVGRLLRAAHLDELPQLINIIEGDMSIVGPRPIPCDMNVKNIANWELRSTIRPGLTGLAQIHCTKYTTLHSKFHFDALYVKRASLWLDTKLVIATAWKIKSILVFAAWTGVILLATLLPIAEESIPAVGAFEHIDKVAHFLLFAVMTLVAVWFGRSFLGSLGRAVGFGVIWGLLLAGGTEFAQSFLPLRNMSVLDFGADMAGVGFYVLMLIFDKTETELG